MQSWLNAISSLGPEGREAILLLLMGFTLGLLFSSVFGLGPALIIRHLIAKAPMPMGRAALIYIPIITVSMISFKVINQSPSGTIIPWIIFYFVGLWILTRKGREKSQPPATAGCEGKIAPGQPLKSETVKKPEKISQQAGGLWPHFYAMVGLLLLLGFIYFVWPTPYKDMGFPNPERAVRQNRLSGDIEQWDYETGSWQKVEDRAKRIKEGQNNPFLDLISVEAEHEKTRANIIINPSPR
jgi:hypothetical protein